MTTVEQCIQEADRCRRLARGADDRTKNALLELARECEALAVELGQRDAESPTSR